MTEYYTTKSLATAAAAIEQGFEGVETYDKYLWNMEWRKVFDARTEYEQWRFPKTPHNVALMEVQLKDWCHYILYLDKLDFNDGYLGMVDGVYGQDKITLDNYEGKLGGLQRNPYLTSKHLIIICRNNKPFPVWDKEEVRCRNQHIA